MTLKSRAGRPVRTMLAAALALVSLPALAQTQNAFTQTFFFGDSLTDAGYYRPLLPANLRPVAGQFTTNPDFVWSQYFADYYGTGAAPNGNGQTGTNYAAGAARVGSPNSGPFGAPAPPLSTQIANYLASTGERADPDALYTVWGGANDLFAAAVPGTTPAQAQAIIGSAVTTQVALIARLQAAGARYVMVPIIPDLGLTPLFRAQGPLAQAQATALAKAYNDALLGSLKAAGLRVIPLDVFNLFREVVASPASFGFRNVTGTACQPQIVAQSFVCNPTTYVTPDAADTYAFADGVHPTGAAHEIIADYAVSMIEGPRQIALLPHSAAMVGRARADRVSAQVAVKPAEDGRHWWVDVRGDNQRFGKGGTGAGFDGSGPAVTLGVNWNKGDLVYGGFIGHGRNEIDYGGRRGDFTQSETSIGGVAGMRTGNFWLDGQLSYTKLSFDVERDIKLGISRRTHVGSPDGDNLTVAVNAGWDLGKGRLDHGPVLGLIAQYIDVDGYAENDPGLSTSLAYPGQSYDSMIATAGWQASFAITDTITQYAKLTYDHEFEDAAEHAFASAQSLPGSMEYVVPGLVFDQNYGTFTMGSRTRMFGLDANLGYHITVGQAGGDHATVFATVGKGF